MSIMRILRAPNPILSTRALEIEKVDVNIRKLMDDMLDTMYDDQGIGLAANQVGILKRVIVLDLGTNDDGQREANYYPLLIANPEIIEFSDELVEAEEGCLSVPEQKISVIRPEKIKLKYLNRENKQETLYTGGWLARALQHEIDHLNGRLIINYLSPLKKNVILRKLKKLQKNI